MRKALAIILVIVFVTPLVMGTLSLFSVSTWLLDRGFYLELVSDERIYEALLRDALRREAHVSELAGVPGLDQVPADALLAALREVVTPSYLRSQAVKLVNDAFDALEGRSEYLGLDLDLAPLKEQLLGEDGRRFALELASSLPVCAAGLDPVAPGAVLYRCRPADLSVEAAAERLHTRLPEFLASVPDLYPLEPEQIPLYYGPEEAFRFGLVGTGPLVWFSIILAIVAGGFWIGAAFVGGSNRREVVQWLGWPLVAPAILMLISGLSIRAVNLWRWLPRELQGFLGAEHWYTREVSEVLLTVVLKALNTVSRGFLISGGVTIGIAVGLIVWASSIPADQEAG
ncbi:MAG: hypothetical protein JW820_12575 [Spirochaetales bacterium]|nr:hypothetical protein [Spirochaetales bacterium]